VDAHGESKKQDFEKLKISEFCKRYKG